MDHLPKELLLGIFINLPFGRKQTCMLVCKKWRELIASRCLYHTLFIGTTNVGEGFSTYKEFISIMEQSPKIRQQVAILFIEPWAAGDDFDIGTLTAYFPNLRRVSYSRRKVSFHEYSTDTLEHPAPAHHIEYISDSNGCALIKRLSADNMCTHLVELDLHLLEYSVAENFFTLLPSLNNMPSLKHFTLGQCGYLVDDLEELHDNINTLETLNIEFSWIIKQEQNFDSVAPAETMKRLSVEVFSHDLDKCVDLLAFIRRKYTQLERLSFYFYDYEHSKDHDVLLKQINDKGYLPLIQQLGPRLKSLQLDGIEYNDYNVIPQMDASHYQIKKFSLNAKYDTKCLPILSESQQAKTIEHLTLNKMIWPSSYNFLKSFSSLNTLCISFAGINEVIDEDEEEQAEQNVVNLNALLRSCPDTLKAVHLYKSIITFNRRGRRQVFQIETLRIAYCAVEDGFETFAAHSLPNCTVIRQYFPYPF